MIRPTYTSDDFVNLRTGNPELLSDGSIPSTTFLMKASYFPDRSNIQFCCKPASHVFCMGYWFKMAWVYAFAVAARMVKRRASGDVSNNEAIIQNMCPIRFSSDSYRCWIPIIGKRTKPNPASGLFVYAIKGTVSSAAGIMLWVIIYLNASFITSCYFSLTRESGFQATAASTKTMLNLAGRKVSNEFPTQRIVHVKHKGSLPLGVSSSLYSCRDVEGRHK